MIRLTRRYGFPASHRLHTAALTDRENAALYGKCNNAGGHGHNYVLEVSVRGPLDESTGRVVAVATLDKLVEDRVLSRLRYRDLGREAAELAGAVPTTENLALGIRKALLEGWSEAFPEGTPALDSVKVHETRKNMFEAPVRI
ncbi:MAG TPA: 6-carboxytetrahydropterin synthase [Bryobacteraceae bacterium]|nr:6-carboxytetrahydropterin synthase [Bryobacteraceae bacterium]